MFDSQYIKGTKPAAFDLQISDFLSGGPEGGGNAMRFAIENEQGQVYRHITAHGMGSYLRLNLFLANDLGLHDKNKHTSRGAHYCINHEQTQI